MLIRAAEGFVIYAKDVDGHLALIQFVRVAYQHLNGCGALGDHILIHHAVKHHTRVGWHHVLGPLPALRGCVCRVQKLVVQIPDGTRVDDIGSPQSAAIRKFHTGRFIVLKENGNCFLLQKHVSAVFFDDFLQLSGQKEGGAGGVITAAYVVIHKHYCCQDSRGFFHGGVAVGRGEFVKEFENLGVFEIFA